MRLDSNLSQVSEYELPLDEEWELDRSLITLVDTLGEGAFGRVMKADAIGLKNLPYSSYVAVKMLKGIPYLFSICFLHTKNSFTSNGFIILQRMQLNTN